MCRRAAEFISAARKSKHGVPWGLAALGRKPGYEDKKAELEARLG